MFCSNCGAEISEKYAFCKFCGAPQPKNQPADEAKVTPDVVPDRKEYISDSRAITTPTVQPTDTNTDNQPKKSHTNMIILTVVAIILVAAVAVTAILLFGQKDRPDTDSDANQAQTESSSDSVTTSTIPSEALSVVIPGSTSTTTTTATSESSSSTATDSSTSESENVSTKAPSAVIPPSPTSAPNKPSLSSAETVALNHVRSLFPLNPKTMSNYELLGWSNYLKIVDNSVIKATNKSSKSDAYAEMSKVWGVPIHNAEDLIDVSLDEIDHSASIAERYGSNITVTGKNFNSSYITKDQAQTYINQTIAKNKSYSKIVVDPSLINWNSVDYYAKVTFDGSVSGSLKTETDLQVYILGSVNGTWKVLYCEEPDEPNGKMGFMSLTFLNNFFYAG